MGGYSYYRDRDRDAFWLDVQSDLLSNLNSRVVVPLLPPKTAPAPAQRLNPMFKIAAKDYVMVTQFIAAMPEADLSAAAGNLSKHHEEIVAALDMLFQGF